MLISEIATQHLRYPLANRNNWYGNANYQQTGGVMTHMTPAEFLAKARPLVIDDISRENINDLKTHIQAGYKLDPLALYSNGQEDGRHRAVAAAELGIKQVPVLVWPAQLSEAAPRLTAADYERLLAAQRQLEGLRAAIRDPVTGKIYTGRSHMAAIHTAPQDGSTFGRLYQEFDTDSENVGYIDPAGRFISRDQADRQWDVATAEDIRDRIRYFRSKTHR